MDQVNDIWSARIFAVWLSIVCGVLCTYLDEGIIATAIPQITDQFSSLDDVGVSLTTLDSRRRGILCATNRD